MTGQGPGCCRSVVYICPCRGRYPFRQGECGLAAKTKIKKKKCSECRSKCPLPDLHLLKVEIQTRPLLPWLVLRNFVGLLLGYVPENRTKKSWLFGNYQRTETKKVSRWFCFDCYIKLLTPKEFELFRNAYYEDAVVEDGQERAAELVSRLDAVFAGHAEAGLR